MESNPLNCLPCPNRSAADALSHRTESYEAWLSTCRASSILAMQTGSNKVLENVIRNLAIVAIVLICIAYDAATRFALKELNGRKSFMNYMILQTSIWPLYTPLWLDLSPKGKKLIVAKTVFSLPLLFLFPFIL